MSQLARWVIAFQIRQPHLWMKVVEETGMGTAERKLLTEAEKVAVYSDNLCDRLLAEHAQEILLCGLRTLKGVSREVIRRHTSGKDLEDVLISLSLVLTLCRYSESE
jgi:hypothetical protein